MAKCTIVCFGGVVCLCCLWFDLRAVMLITRVVGFLGEDCIQIYRLIRNELNLNIDNLLILSFQMFLQLILLFRQFGCKTWISLLHVAIESGSCSVHKVLLKLDLVTHFSQNSRPDFSFKREHCLLEQRKKSALGIKLVNHLVSFLKKFSIDQVRNVLLLE